MTEDLRLAVALNGYGLVHAEPDGGWIEVLPWPDLQGLATLAERLGYEAIYAPEIRGREAFSTLAGFATQTRRIGLASGVMPLWSREIQTFAIGASSLHEMSGGRFTLGLGSNMPIDRTRELVRAIRATIAGEEGLVTDETTGETLATGQIDWFVHPRHVPVYLAALGPRMTALAGDVGDGVILNWCTPERVAEARRAVGEDRTVAVYVRACVTGADDDMPDELRWAAARYAAMDPYRRQFHAMGLGAAADAAAERRVDAAGLPEGVDGLVEATCVWGDRRRALRRLGAYRDAGADVVVAYPVPARDAVSSISGTMMALAPDPGVET